jgi:hypothetical protein
MTKTHQLVPPGTALEIAEAVALFRYGLIADLLHLPPGHRTLHAQLRVKADRDHEIPGSTRRRVAAETIRDWLYAYRRGGFDALKPRPRCDTEHTRAVPQAVADQFRALKEAHPAFSVAMLLSTARQQQFVPPEIVLAPATVHRLLSRQGLMGRQASVPFTGNTRLPMVAGWDGLMPAWFTRLHPRYQTPVNSIAVVGAITFGFSVLAQIGVGKQEAFQLLWVASGSSLASWGRPKASRSVPLTAELPS